MSSSDKRWLLWGLLYLALFFLMFFIGDRQTTDFNCHRDMKAFAMCKQDPQCKITTQDMRSYNWCWDRFNNKP